MIIVSQIGFYFSKNIIILKNIDIQRNLDEGRIQLIIQRKNTITALLWIPNSLSPTRIIPCATNKMSPNETTSNQAQTCLSLVLLFRLRSSRSPFHQVTP